MVVIDGAARWDSVGGREILTVSFLCNSLLLSCDNYWDNVQLPIFSVVCCQYTHVRCIFFFFFASVLSIWM